MKTLKSNKKFIISLNIFILFILLLIIIFALINNKNKKINNDLSSKVSSTNNVSGVNSKNNVEVQSESEDMNLVYNNPNDEYLVLVNREHSLEENYEPDDLVIPNIPLQTSSNMIGALIVVFPPSLPLNPISSFFNPK